MADETIDSVVDDQRATDPRLEQPAPAPEPAPDAPPEPEALAEPEASEGDAKLPEGEAPPPEEPKKRRTAEEVLKGRVGHLTKTLSAKDAAIAAAEARAEAAEALLASARRTPTAEGETPPAEPAPAMTINPATGRVYTQAEFDRAVTAKAQADAFNRQADAMYDTGSEKFKDTWKESVDMLNATGILDPRNGGVEFLDAAMATDAGAEVIHFLGTDLDEATRIANLPPARMGAEMAKLASRLSAPASPTRVSVSGAPAPIKPVTGAVNPQVDLGRIAETDDMSAYAAARAKQGSRWANPRTRN